MTEQDDPVAQRLSKALRDLDADDLRPPAPPSALWSRLSEAAMAEPLPPVAESHQGVTTSSAVETRSRRAPRILAVAAAFAAVAVLAVGALLVSGRDARPALDVTARASLDGAGLPLKTDASGKAAVIQEGSDRVLSLDLTQLPKEGDGVVFEVWLFDGKGDMQSLGLTTGNSRHVIPADVDLDQFSVVDISKERLGGDPAHSTESLLRGKLA